MSDNKDNPDLDLTEEELIDSLKKLFSERKKYYNLMTQAILSTLVNPRAAALLLLDSELARMNLIDKNKDPREQYTVSWDDCEIVKKSFEEGEKDQLLMYFTIILNESTPAAETIGKDVFLTIRLEIPVEHAFRPTEEIISYLKDNIVFSELTETIATTIDALRNVYHESKEERIVDNIQQYHENKILEGELTKEQKEKLRLAMKTGNYSKAKN